MQGYPRGGSPPPRPASELLAPDEGNRAPAAPWRGPFGQTPPAASTHPPTRSRSSISLVGSAPSPWPGGREHSFPPESRGAAGSRLDNAR